MFPSVAPRYDVIYGAFILYPQRSCHVVHYKKQWLVCQASRADPFFALRTDVGRVFIARAMLSCSRPSPRFDAQPVRRMQQASSDPILFISSCRTLGMRGARALRQETKKKDGYPRVPLDAFVGLLILL